MHLNGHVCEHSNCCLQFDSMRKQSDMNNMSDVNTTQLRGQVETRYDWNLRLKTYLSL